MVRGCDRKSPIVCAGLWQAYDHSLHHHAKLAVNALFPWESGAVVHDSSFPDAVCACSNFLVGSHAMKSIGESKYRRHVPAYVAFPVVSFHEEGVLDCVDHSVHPWYVWVLGRNLRQRW